SEGHRRNVRRALDAVEIDFVERPLVYLNEWTRLYRLLVERHKIRGIATFSPDSFARQLQAPGCTADAAFAGGHLVGMVLWYQHNSVVYYHLGAYDDIGYRVGASFALFANAIERFTKTGFRWLSLGGVAGIHSQETGLSRFKRGWATDTKPA